VLAAPHLDATAFEKLLTPFLDDDLLFPREDEYRTTLSIFAPVSDAITRAHLTPRQIHACLLVGAGTSLPFPRSGEWATNTDLSVPETRITGNLTLRVELADSSDRPLMVQAAELPAPLIQGQRLAVSYRMDENQDLHFKVKMDGDPDRAEWTFRQENPLSNVVNLQPRPEGCAGGHPRGRPPPRHRSRPRETELMGTR
jgi:hypothetical protein